MTNEQKVVRFREITTAMADLYENKNKNYGDSFGKLFRDLGPVAGLVPLHNKIDRLTSLINGGTENKFESIEDTFKDLACYAIMNLIAWEEKNEVKKNYNYEEDTFEDDDDIKAPYEEDDCEDKENESKEDLDELKEHNAPTFDEIEDYCNKHDDDVEACDECPGCKFYKNVKGHCNDCPMNEAFDKAIDDYIEEDDGDATASYVHQDEPSSQKNKDEDKKIDFDYEDDKNYWLINFTLYSKIFGVEVVLKSIERVLKNPHTTKAYIDAANDFKQMYKEVLEEHKKDIKDNKSSNIKKVKTIV